MSQHRTGKIACPSCNRNDTIRIYERVDSTDNSACRKLIKGSLLRYRCPKCGYITNIGYNLLYRNEERKFMVYFVADGDVRGMQKAMDDIEKQANRLAPSEEFRYNITRRIVLDVNDLREKIIIFEAGLDDRIVEVIKLFYINAIREENPEINIVGCSFLIADDKWKFEFGTDTRRVFTIDIQKDLYKTFDDEYREEINQIGDTYFVDRNYAINIYGKNIN